MELADVLQGDIDRLRRRYPALVCFGSAVRRRDSGFNADEVLYIDDSTKNIKAARELEITSHVYTEKELLKQFLQEHLGVQI